ncbi:MAG: phenylpropionate dioxygenase-like ring-hydroxylating dioxygenase large terminal subunit [Gammaproteobacteria bacterium]|jgi:phenylpropionate dioxygenase-like ring-hydroxylating dioxygenase large terminal subunit
MSDKLVQAQIKVAQKGRNASAKKSHSLHKACYTQRAYFEAETEQVFKKTWQFVCHEEKLREPLSYVTTEVSGQSILLTRTNEGKLHAFYNVCKHRAHELLSGEGKTPVITCPYHAWVYGLNGQLQNARRSELIDDFEVKEICLTSVNVEIFCHLVFINLDPTAQPLSQATGALAHEVKQYAPDIGELTFAKRLTYKIQANWKAVVDNFLECYHCPTAHKDFCSLIDMETYKVTTQGLYSSHMAKAKLADNTAYSVENASVTDHAVWFLWPNMALMRYPGAGNFMVWRFYPVNEHETYEVFDFYFESDTPSDTELEAIAFIDDVLQPEDIALVESVQRGMQTPGFEQGRYMVDDAGSGMSEHALHHFHGLLLDVYRNAAENKKHDLIVVA